MFSVEVPRGPDGTPLLPEALWAPLDPVVRAVVEALATQVTVLATGVGELEARVGPPWGNSSRPPSSAPPGAPRRPPAPPSGRRPGGQPGHIAHQRAVIPPERVDHIV